MGAAAALVDIDAGDNDVIRNWDTFSKVQTATLWATGALSEVNAGGYLRAKVTAPRNGTPGYAFSAASLDYATLLHAPAVCGIAEGRAYILPSLGLNNGGGVAMERWEDP